MALLTLANIEKSFGKRTILQDLSFQISRGERVGLIGDNGTGKTSIFKIITGKMIPEIGKVQLARGSTVGHLTQDPQFGVNNTLLDEAELAFADLHQMSHDLRDLEHAMAEHAGDQLDATLKTYEDLLHRFEEADGYAWRHKLEAVLDGVGLARDDWETPVTLLSGGQKSRLALAKLLIAEPDLLLLDEPTNHLDLEAIEWLENWLLRFEGAVLLISHDRYLLDRLATRIVWLTDLKLASFPGNYSAFVKQRELHELTQQRAFAQQQAAVAKEEEYIRRFKAGQRARQAAGREKRLDRLKTSGDMVRQVSQSKQMTLSIGGQRKLGDRLLQVKDLAKRYDGKQLWQNVEFEITPGERVGMFGPNGSGKTTLLRVLLGQEAADAGEIKWGTQLQIGYYDQKLDDYNPEHTVLEEVATDSDLSEQKIRAVLGAMLFAGEAAERRMGDCSGGERARVALTKLLLSQPNVLILDEPTNHLDIRSREALEETLDGYEGTILCISHDRYFLERVAQRLFVIHPPKLIDFPGDYDAWRAAERTKNSKPAENNRNRPAGNPQKPAGTQQKPAPDPRPPAKPAARPPAKSQNKYARPFGAVSDSALDEEIIETETELAAAQERLADPDLYRDPAEARRAQDAFNATKKKLAQLEDEFLIRSE